MNCESNRHKRDGFSHCRGFRKRTIERNFMRLCRVHRLKLYFKLLIPVYFVISRTHNQQRQEKPQYHQYQTVRHPRSCSICPIRATAYLSPTWCESVPSEKRRKHGYYTIDPCTSNKESQCSLGESKVRIETLQAVVDNDTHFSQGHDSRNSCGKKITVTMGSICRCRFV